MSRNGGKRLMENFKELDLKIKEMAGRIRELREIEGISPQSMAKNTGVSVDEYLACESGKAILTLLLSTAVPKLSRST